ncbi:unnamed protein product [Callosobruchus maculatus]|uniref:G-protein coupled receptors family 1 profile domain-containing protein n=1 Tax=Callosobruchus maculatus TaxID=64391 RepID=A0A653BPT5_CALMS|nr:unnamed protein product [Callosobruchus maculatus]
MPVRPPLIAQLLRQPANSSRLRASVSPGHLSSQLPLVGEQRRLNRPQRANFASRRQLPTQLTMDNSTEENDIPPHVWAILHELLLGVGDQTLDLREAHLKTSFAKIYPFVIFVYGLIVAIALLTNLYVFIHIVRLKLYNNCTYGFLLNNVISDIVKCIVVIPVSLYVLLVQNWVLGELLCSFLPMIQLRINLYPPFGFFSKKYEDIN